MNWLKRARLELQQSARRRTAVAAETLPTSLTAARDPALSREAVEVLRDAWEERAAVLEFDGGLTRKEAERFAWLSIYCSTRLH